MFKKKKIKNSFFNPIQENEIEKLITNLSLNKTANPCSIPTKTEKKAGRCFKKFLSCLTNRSF